LPKITHEFFLIFYIRYNSKVLCSFCLLSIYNKGLIIKISIIIPVYKEKRINLYLQALLENNSLKKNEIIVVDGHNDSTIKDIHFENIIKITSEKGRAKQMNKAAQLASGSVLLFLHADTILPKNALNLIRQSLNKDIVAGAFDLSFDSSKKALKLISKIASIRSRLTSLPYGDQAIFIKKDIFEKIGFYEEIPLMEDVNLMQKLKKKKYKIKILKERVRTSSRKWENKGLFYTTLRNWLLISLYFIGVKPKNLVKYYT